MVKLTEVSSDNVWTRPPLFTMVLTALPPEYKYSPPPLFTVVLKAVPNTS
jgi:hypothetical protein